MQDHTSASASLSSEIVKRVEGVLLDAEQSSKPVEVDPYRGQLFELFVTAEGAGYVDEDAECDLTADGLCHELSARWNLADATRESVGQQTKLAPEHLSKMRLLWSVMRMWMEWDYAWQRWREFHASSRDLPSSDAST